MSSGTRENWIDLSEPPPWEEETWGAKEGKAYVAGVAEDVFWWHLQWNEQWLIFFLYKACWTPEHIHCSVEMVWLAWKTMASFKCGNIFHMKATGVGAILFSVVNPTLCSAIFYRGIRRNRQQHRSGSVIQSGRKIYWCCKKQPKINNSRQDNEKIALQLFLYSAVRFLRGFFSS